MKKTYLSALLGMLMTTALLITGSANAKDTGWGCPACAHAPHSFVLR